MESPSWSSPPMWYCTSYNSPEPGDTGMAKTAVATKDHLELVGVSEVADLLRISKQRVSQLLNNDSTFPAPLAFLRATPVWDKADIRVWAKAYR